MLGVLYELNSKIFLLGANYDKCTSFHLSEHITGIFPKVMHCGAIMENGVHTWKIYKNYDSDTDSLLPMGEAFEEVYNK